MQFLEYVMKNNQVVPEETAIDEVLGIKRGVATRSVYRKEGLPFQHLVDGKHVDQTWGGRGHQFGGNNCTALDKVITTAVIGGVCAYRGQEGLTAAIEYGNLAIKSTDMFLKGLGIDAANIASRG